MYLEGEELNQRFTLLAYQNVSSKSDFCFEMSAQGPYLGCTWWVLCDMRYRSSLTNKSHLYLVVLGSNPGQVCCILHSTSIHYHGYMISIPFCKLINAWCMNKLSNWPWLRSQSDCGSLCQLKVQTECRETRQYNIHYWWSCEAQVFVVGLVWSRVISLGVDVGMMGSWHTGTQRFYWI